MRAKSIYILRNLQRRRNTRNPTSRTQECSMNDKATKPAVASNSGFPVAESLPAFLTPRKNNIDEKTQKLRLGDNCTTHPFRNASISITAVFLPLIWRTFVVKSALGASPMAPGSRLDTVLSMQYTVEVWVHLTKNVKDWHGCARSTFVVRAYT